jgi:hypothetical protein
MNQPRKIQRHRKLPPGSVLEIQLADNCFAYICFTVGDFYWLFDFVTDHPLSDTQLLTTQRWRLPLFISDDPPKTWRLVAIITLTEQEAKVPPMWVKIGPDSMHYEAPTLYQIYSPGTDPEYDPYYYISEEQTKTHHPCRGTNPEKFTEYISEFLPELERISVPEAVDGSKPLTELTLPPQVNEPERPILEVQFPCYMEDLGMEEWEIIDAFDDALNGRELGLATSVDSGFSLCADDKQTGFTAEFSVVLEIEPGRLKNALTRIRRVLKKLKAPSTTRIVEMTDDGNIVHPFSIQSEGK